MLFLYLRCNCNSYPVILQSRVAESTVKGHKYSSLSKKMREIFTPVVHTINRKTWCMARVWSIKAEKISTNRNKQTSDQEHEKNCMVPERKEITAVCVLTSRLFMIKFKLTPASQVEVGCRWARGLQPQYTPRRKNTHRPTNPQPSHEPPRAQPPTIAPVTLRPEAQWK